MAEKNWKDLFLRSGLPLEYEVKETFVSMGCSAWDEYSYLKANENNIDQEFSYDLDTIYWKGRHCFNFMVECKYKTEPTKWLFLPDPYAYQADISRNAFLHTIDHFTEKKFIFDHEPYDKVQPPLGPYCLKGTEILSDNAKEQTIRHAIHQLSYAFVDKTIESLEEQLRVDMFKDSLFFNIPVIITNADLYLCNTDMGVEAVKAATRPEDIASRHDCLLFHNKIGEQLRQHNLASLAQFMSKNEEKFHERIHSFTDDPSHFINVLSRNYCPEIILIMHHDQARTSYKRLFDYINFLITASPELDQKIKEITEKQKATFEKLKHLRPKKTSPEPGHQAPPTTPHNPEA